MPRPKIQGVSTPKSVFVKYTTKSFVAIHVHTHLPLPLHETYVFGTDTANEQAVLHQKPYK